MFTKIPPAAAGGIPESQNSCRNFSCLVCVASLTRRVKEICGLSGLRNFRQWSSERAAQTVQFALQLTAASLAKNVDFYGGYICLRIKQGNCSAARRIFPSPTWSDR